MKHGAVRKLMRAAIWSLLVLGTISGVAGMQGWAASPAMAQPADPGGGSNDQGSPGSQGGGSTPGSGTPSNPVTKLVGGLVGGSGAEAH
jgi:hypothetical protein